MLILVCGYIGVGKSTVAQRIAQKIDGTILRTDEIRSGIYPNPTHSREEIQHVYELFFEELKKLLREDKNVVLDATFHLKENREKIINIAEKLKVDLKIVEVRCDSNEETRKRIENRNDGVSKTDYQQYLKHKAEFEEIDEEKIIINNNTELKNAYDQIDAFVSNIKF
ncbi:MAG TPA: hypothetical protein DDY52_00895 [Candidatus Moranbacteria bacterium]|nr:MAG: putative kinase [Candidatus Moranbacteria bacterium GW2011_GWF1_34_10]HBI16703.1 hypothetical protein [Candidatus Moranbacteria bacterium]